jgi:hypothetical protein
MLDASAARVLLLLVWPMPSALLTTAWLTSTWLASTLLLLAGIPAAATLLALSVPVLILLLVHGHHSYVAEFPPNHSVRQRGQSNKSRLRSVEITSGPRAHRLVVDTDVDALLLFGVLFVLFGVLFKTLVLILDFALGSDAG